MIRLTFAPGSSRTSLDPATETPSPPAGFTLQHPLQRTTAQGRTEPLQGRTRGGIEARVTARPVTRRFFTDVRWALTLAPLGNGQIGSDPLTNPLPIPPALAPTAGLALVRGPIPLPGTPGSPTPGRLPAGLTAIPRLRIPRLERPLAPLQQTQPTPWTTSTKALNLGTLAAMLRRAQGRC